MAFLCIHSINSCLLHILPRIYFWCQRVNFTYMWSDHQIPTLNLQEEKIKHQHLLSVVIFCLNVHIMTHITSNFCTIYNSLFWVSAKEMGTISAHLKPVPLNRTLIVVNKRSSILEAAVL